MNDSSAHHPAGSCIRTHMHILQIYTHFCCHLRNDIHNWQDYNQIISNRCCEHFVSYFILYKFVLYCITHTERAEHKPIYYALKEFWWCSLAPNRIYYDEPVLILACINVKSYTHFRYNFFFFFYWQIDVTFDIHTIYMPICGLMQINFIELYVCMCVCLMLTAAPLQHRIIHFVDAAFVNSAECRQSVTECVRSVPYASCASYCISKDGARHRMLDSTHQTLIPPKSFTIYEIVYLQIITIIFKFQLKVASNWIDFQPVGNVRMFVIRQCARLWSDPTYVLLFNVVHF